MSDVFNIPRKHICKAVIIKQMNSNQKIKHLILSKNQFKHIPKQKVTVVIKPRNLVLCLPHLGKQFWGYTNVHTKN